VKLIPPCHVAVDARVGPSPCNRVAGFPVSGPVTAIWLVVLAVAATGGALVLLYTLISRAGAIRANLAGYLAPAFAIVFGRAFLSEPIHAQAIAGLVLILIGSYLAAT
jgi:drug/metabolite transporter (DMT)-like permease